MEKQRTIAPIMLYEQRSCITDALNKAIEIFVSHNDKNFKDVLSDALRPIVEVTELSRIVVYRVLEREPLKLGQTYRWDKSGENGGGLIDIAEELRILPNIPVLCNWISMLSKGERVSINTSVMTEDEKSFADTYGIKSMLMIPVFVHGELWGGVTFQDHEKERDLGSEYFSDSLQSAALLYVNAIIRSENKRDVTEAFYALKRGKDITDTLNHAAIHFLSQNLNNFKDTMNAGIGLIADLAELDRIGLFRNFDKDGSLHASQIYRWDRKTGGTTDPTPGLEDVSYDRLAPRWKKLLENGEVINSPVKLLPEASLLQSFGVVSAYLQPVFINNSFWGFVLFEDREEERFFEEDIAEMMKSAAFLCANTVLRDVNDKRLKEALHSATVASEAKSEFLSNMSHEMRTPLNAIIGMTSIGKKTDSIERKDYALGRIEEASTHLLGVINDVLDMSKIEAKRFELSPVEFNFERMIQRIVTMINYRVTEKQQTLNVNVDKKLPRFVIGDDQRLSQVIMNLLSNAVKFTPEKGKIDFEVFLDSDKDDMCEIRVEVADTGIGISDEQKQKLFRAFGQAESGTSRKYGGTGLGLAISKQIVEMMDGSIGVESEIDKGARFIFTVKLTHSTKNIKNMLLPGVSWKTLRVLAVDDDSAVREFFSDLFESIGVTCDTAADSGEALEIIEKRGEYDIYFIDWRMPGMDGIGLTGKIKNGDNAKPHIVVMNSGVDWSDIKDEATRAGVDKYLLKPLMSSLIIDCINECLGVDDDSGRAIGDLSGKFVGRRILLAEDVEINREIVLSLLEDTGLEIDCAENGAEALEMVEKSNEKYGMVFMDMQMPKMDGLEATRKIRSLKGGYYKKLPIIAMTANVFKDDIEKCLAAGMNGHIGKPLDIDAVNEKLRKYLK